MEKKMVMELAKNNIISSFQVGYMHFHPWNRIRHLYFSLYLSLSLYFYIYLSLYLSISLFLYISISLSLYVSLSLSLFYYKRPPWTPIILIIGRWCSVTGAEDRGSLGSFPIGIRCSCCPPPYSSLSPYPPRLPSFLYLRPCRLRIPHGILLSLPV